PLTTDYERWRRVAFDSPQRMAFQRMDETFAFYGSKIDLSAKSLTLTQPGDAKWSSTFTFDRQIPDRMTLEGVMDGKRVQMHLTLYHREKFLLVTRGFNWIQEYPFNR